MGDNARTQGKFKGINNFCKTCEKTCKQFENIHVIYCPMRISLKKKAKKALTSTYPLASVLDESQLVGENLDV